MSRDLSIITFDLSTVRSRLASLLAATSGRNAGDGEEQLWHDLDQRRITLEDEFRTVFRSVTGVDWDIAERVMS